MRWRPSVIPARLAAVATPHRQALGQERTLREAATAFASAATLTEIAAAARSAAAALTGPQGAPAVLALRRGDRYQAVGADGPEPAPGPVHAAIAAWLPMLTGPGPRLIRATLPGEGGAGHPAGRGAALVCPLPLTGDGDGGDLPGGVLAVFGDHRTLAALSRPAEVLASQVTLAVDRVLRSQESSRRDSEAFFRSLAQDASDVIVVLDSDGKVKHASPSAARLFGDAGSADPFLWDLVRPEDRDAIVVSFTRMLDSETSDEVPDEPTRWQLAGRDGERAEVEVHRTDLRHDPAVGGLLLTLHDVTQQRALEREMAHRARHDALTGLPNRVLFTDRATHALARSRRAGTTVAVLVIDLDEFSTVNDTLGHGVGDELLVAAADRLSALARDHDTAARLGADEFGLLVEDVAGDAAAEALAERVVQAFSEPFPLVNGPVLATATVGIATTEDSGDAGDLVRHADLALYAAKAAGKRQWRRYQPILSISMVKRRELRSALDDAVAGSAFTLAYQPIVALATGEVAGFEALARWPHPRWGMIHPDQFITLAEETGHIVQLGAWVLRQAVTDLVTWQRRAHRKALYVSVNVSARQFRDPGFVAGVREVLGESGLEPSSLLLELTESVLLGRDERIRASLTELKSLGVRLAIDDFGTGYSSLSYLRELPVDVLKIDRSFTEGIAVSKARLALVEVIVRMAKTLGLTVMAEGIESETQRELLISLGCKYGQGYLLEKPVAADDAEALARAGLRGELRPASH